MSGFPWIWVSKKGENQLFDGGMTCFGSQTINDRIGRSFEDGVDQIVPKSLTNIWRSPEQSERNLYWENPGSYRGNTWASGHKEDLAEETGNTHHAPSRNTANPDFRRGVLNGLARPITGTTYDHRVAFLSWNRNCCEAMPFWQRGRGNANESSWRGSCCIMVNSSV